jgi:fructose-1,6-bisphosphatase/inositol monophosphatase family enzyme
MSLVSEEVEDAALRATGAWGRRALAIAARVRRGSLGTMAKADAYDLTTTADREIEAYLRRAVRRRFPDHAVGGEEEGVGAPRSGWHWLIDPVDGTFNFVTGLAASATSLALLHDGTPRVGGVADLGTGEVLIARSGGPLLRSDGRAGWVVPPTDGTGAARLFLEYGAERLDDWMIDALHALSATRDTIPRLIGSAAVALATVALHGGCFVGVGLKAWDVAGGVCLAEASGYTVRWWRDPFPGVHVLVGANEVVRDLEGPVHDLVTRWRAQGRPAQ